VNSGKPVLNVDDSAPARFLRTRILRDAGFPVEEAESAVEALERGPQASLVVLDVHLRDGDGFSVCQRLKQLAPAVPVVMVTSVYQQAQARRDAFTIGADAYLLEPVPPEQLVRTLRHLLSRPADPNETLGAAWIITDQAGTILDLSEVSANMLNISVRAARGRSLPTFFTDNRHQLITDVNRAADGLIVARSTVLAPRDRRKFMVHIDVSALPRSAGEPIELHWILSGGDGVHGANA
jgi:CheY-like chemotaxis protein